jgi:hypothetical protein
LENEPWLIYPSGEIVGREDIIATEENRYCLIVYRKAAALTFICSARSAS